MRVSSRIFFGCLFLVLIAGANVTYAQNVQIDSLYKVYKVINTKGKLNTGMALIRNLLSSKQFPQAQKIINQLERLPVEPGEADAKPGLLNYLKSLYFQGTGNLALSNSYALTALPFLTTKTYYLADAQSVLILNSLNANKYDSCIMYEAKYLKSLRNSNNPMAITESYLAVARCYQLLGNRQKSIEKALIAVDLAKQNKIKNKLIFAYIILSSVYNDEDLNLGLVYANAAIREIGSSESEFLPEAYLMLGNTYTDLEKPDSAKICYALTTKWAKKFEKDELYLAAVGNLGNLAYEAKKYNEAFKYFELALIGYKKKNSLLEIAVSYGALADFYREIKNYKTSVLYYDSALLVTSKINSAEDFILNYKGLSETYELMGDYKNAFQNFKLYKFWNDSINNNQNSKKIVKLGLEYKFNAQKKENDLIQRNKDLITHEKIEKQKYIIWSAVICGLLLVLFLGFMVKSNVIRKKTNKKLQIFNNEIITQKNIIETKNHEITDSITYASRIQQGIIPDADELEKMFPQYFVFYKPRNIVSGDFYWTSYVKRNHANNILLAVADCTGHGVPGAFMSLVGNTLLNQTVNDAAIASPAKALDYINQQLPKTIKSKSSTGTIKDGMEVAMCEFDFNTLTMQFAGANSNIYVVRNKQIQIYRGDKQPIGESFSGTILSYTNQTVALQKGDNIYLITDGFADQFGGEKGKKFKYKPLENLFCSISEENCTEQNAIISNEFIHWIGNHDQVDDILIFGIKI